MRHLNVLALQDGVGFSIFYNLLFVLRWQVNSYACSALIHHFLLL